MMRKLIADDLVEHDWECEGCDDTATVPPTFYEENGTPQCDEGEDMVYVGTFVLTEDGEES